MMQRVKVFIAGSTTEVAKERIVALSTITEWNSTQSLVGKRHTIEFVPYTYKNFHDTIGTDSSQAKYNIFIKNKCDLIIFILAGLVGGRTYDEFKIAYYSLHGKRKAPRIMVFNRQGTDASGYFLAIKNTLKENVKDWIDYDSLDSLSFILKEQLTKLEPEMQERRRHRLIRLFNRVLIPVSALLLVVISILGIRLFNKHRYDSYMRRVEEAIVEIQSTPGLLGIKKKEKTLQFLESHSFPQKDSLYNVVKSL